MHVAAEPCMGFVVGEHGHLDPDMPCAQKVLSSDVRRIKTKSRSTGLGIR